MSLRFLPVSLNQAIGATTLFFTTVFCIMMSKKGEAWIIYATLVPVVAGVIIASESEPNFHIFGFIMCVSAKLPGHSSKCFREFCCLQRSNKSLVLSLQDHRKLKKLTTQLTEIILISWEKLNSMNLLYTEPITVVFLLPTTLLMEENVIGITLALVTKEVKIIWHLLFNSSLAYFLNLTNFLVTKRTIALTLQVLGNAKGDVAVAVSILIFKNPCP